MSTLAFLGTPELIILAVLGLLIFGTRLPKLARSLGQSVNEFKDGLKEGQEGSSDETSSKKDDAGKDPANA